MFRQGGDEYSEFDMFKRSGGMNRCAAMSGTWSGSLYIEFKTKNYLNIILLGLQLKPKLAGHLQSSVIHINES